ncbi:hypothetical protein AMTRI_Chr05g62030 [Amborella trichopoda]
MCCFPNQKIRDSFDMVLSSAIVSSTCSPVSIRGTVSSPGGPPSQFEVFSWKFKAFMNMTIVATINRLATMVRQYALLSRDPYSKIKGPY